MKRALAIVVAVLAARAADPPAAPDALRDPREVHLANVRQLTFGGENAEAYWSADGKQLIFQSKRDGAGCDQIYVMDADGGNPHRISSGKGRTTCSYFFPDGKKVLYASTHLAGDGCPPPPTIPRDTSGRSTTATRSSRRRRTGAASSA